MAQTVVKCFIYTWDELLAAAERRECVTDLQGHILCSRDRVFETRKARDYYQVSVAQAIARGCEVPDAVRAEYEQRILANGLDPDHARFAAWAPAGMSKEDFLKQDTKVVSLCDKRLITDTRPKNAKGKPFSWSYTALSAFEKCPASYAAERFYCTAPFQETEAIVFGNRVHSACEQFIKGEDVSEPDLIVKVAPYLNNIVAQRDKGADVSAEMELALNTNLEPVSWFAKDAWFRGKFDVIIERDDRLSYFDWKTGKKVRDDQDQLKICCAMLSVVKPHITEFNPKLIWTQHQTVTGIQGGSMDKRAAVAVLEDTLARVDRMQKAWQSETFQARSGPLCPWCSQYQTCAYARRR
ncbi:MAG: PD-(D/E)XK nuclease family protein [Candidatus Cloacimonetes bacterium]|nr:PD-(D/E)XK nuclease family protein [Candidatus Cloacimonadota bacterium]MDY0368089.1 PD-(D/E)XK nuclease family protein [Candidatus Syntrophosphaera sp.]